MRERVHIVAVAVALACLIASACARVSWADAEPRVKVERTESPTVTVPLSHDHLTLIQHDGRLVTVPVGLRIEGYTCTEVREGEAGAEEPWSWRMFCYTLASKDQEKPYTWSMWTCEACGQFRLISDSKGRNYLAWVSGAEVYFSEVSEATDSTARLNAYISKRGGVLPYVVRVPAARLVPDVRRWGVNAHYNDVNVRLITKGQHGKWTVKISGPANDRVYTLVSDTKAELGWRLAE